MYLRNRLFTFLGQKVFYIFLVILKEILSEHSRTIRVPANGKVLLPIQLVGHWFTDGNWNTFCYLSQAFS